MQSQSAARIVIALLGISILLTGSTGAQEADAVPAATPAAAAQDPDTVQEASSTGDVQDVTAVEETDPTVELYVAKCASCHTVGQGVRVGPDLADAHVRRERGWLQEMIQNPSDLLARDADARRLLVEYDNVRMPDLDMTSDQTNQLIDLIIRCSAEPCVLVGQFVPVTEAVEADFLRGEALFVGDERTANGSGACISCHDVNGLSTYVPGGTLAADLTNVFARLGDEGIDAALKNPAFPLMNKIFADHPLETDEAFALRAFLYDANRSETSTARDASLLLFGILGTAVVLMVLNAFWRRRLLGVRRELTRPQESSR